MEEFDESEWLDVDPIRQDDGPDPLVPIAYSSRCTWVEQVASPRSPLTEADFVAPPRPRTTPRS